MAYLSLKLLSIVLEHLKFAVFPRGYSLDHQSTKLSCILTILPTPLCMVAGVTIVFEAVHL